MKNLKLRLNIVFFLATITSPITLIADTTCPSEKVTSISTSDTAVFYTQTGSGTRALGYLNTDGTKEKMSLLLTAQASGRKVAIQYPADNYDCVNSNYSAFAKMVTIYDN